MPADASQALTQSGVWSSLSTDSLRRVAAAMRPKRYAAGDTIIRQGDAGNDLHVLVAGKAEARVRTAGGTTITIAQLGVGDCFGEMSLLTGDPTSADVVAVEESETLALDRSSLDDLVSAHPGLLREFVRMISRRLRATDVAVGASREREQQLTRFLREERSDLYREVIGRHPSMKALQRTIEEEARRDSPLLVQGERGTGKELVARLTHFGGPRRELPLLSVDCAHISEADWGDPLFGPTGSGSALDSAGRTCYMELANGGTILLKNVEALPAGVEERLLGFLEDEASPDRRWDVRVIATCRNDLAESAAAGQVSAALASAVAARVIRLPPLRERKRDIPELARHLAAKHAQRLGKSVEGLTDQALIKLVLHDYRFANVEELEECVERAVLLTDEAKVDAPALILGAPPGAGSQQLNLLRLWPRAARLLLRAFPHMLRGIVAAVFGAILLACLVGQDNAWTRAALLMVWSVWWPFLALSFFFAGRAWCAVCPMAFVGQAAQRARSLGRKTPPWIQRNDGLLTMGGFFAITWIEEATGMRHGPRATAALLLAILAGAVTASVLFQRRTWCRHLCPLGGFAGLCSASALVELRPTVDVCTAKCKEHTCYMGDRGVPGCPMFNHVMFVDTNHHCILCLDCVRACPNSSPQLNLRVPGRELWADRGATPVAGAFVALVLALLVPLFLIQQWEAHPAGRWAQWVVSHRFAGTTGLLVLSAAVAFLLLWLAMPGRGGKRDVVASAEFWQRITAWVPLVTAGYVCYQIGFVPGLAHLEVALQYYPPSLGVARALSVPALPALRALILTAGFATTVGVLWRLRGYTMFGEGWGWLRQEAAGLAAAVIYWIVILLLAWTPA